MIMDELGLLRADGSAGAISAAEAGKYGADALDKDAVTGQRVLDIRKTAQAGLPVIVITKPALVSGTYDRTFTVTIEAGSDKTQASTGWETVATFPVTSANIALAAVTMIRRVHTQKRYLRSVIARTVTGTNGTCDFLIFIGHALMNT